MRIAISRMWVSRNAGALCVLLIVSGSWGCGPRGGDVNETLAGTEELLARTEALVQTADTASDPSARVVLLERARTLLYRIMGAEEASAAGTALADGKAVGALSLRRVEGALRSARMDLARVNPEYARLIENALVAAASAHPSEQDLAYETIALAQARLGDIPGALATARNISEQARWRAGRFVQLRWSDPPVVLASLQVRAGDLEGALRTPAELGIPVDDVWAELAFARARTGDIEGVAATIPEVDASFSQAAGDPDELIKLLRIARVWSAIGNADEAAEVLERALQTVEASERPQALARVARAWVEIGRPERAGEPMLRALASVDQPARYGWGTDPDRVASALTQIGEVATARSIADAFSDDISGASVWKAIALALAEQGEVEAALASLPPRDLFVEGAFLRQMATRLAEAGDIPGALAVASELGVGGDPRDIDPWELDFDGVVALVALAAARADAGDIETARKSLGAITGGLESNEPPYRFILDGISDYARATLWQGIGSAWAKAGDPTAARAAFETAARTASMVGMTLPFPPGLQEVSTRERWPDTDLFGVYGSRESFHQGMSEALADYGWPSHDDYAMSVSNIPLLTYARGFTLRQIACAARAAGVPVPGETLREAAMADVRDAWSDQTGYGAESWTLRAVAVALVERPCPDVAE